MCYGDNSLSREGVFINEDMSKKIAEDREAVRQMDLDRYVAQARAAQKKQPYSASRTINDDVKFELFHLICEADMWDLSKTWGRDILKMYFTKSKPGHNSLARETLLLMLDYGLENGSEAAEALEDNLVMLVNTMTISQSEEIEVRTI